MAVPVHTLPISLATYEYKDDPRDDECNGRVVFLEDLIHQKITADVQSKQTDGSWKSIYPLTLESVRVFIPNHTMPGFNSHNVLLTDCAFKEQKAYIQAIQDRAAEVKHDLTRGMDGRNYLSGLQIRPPR